MGSLSARALRRARGLAGLLLVCATGALSGCGSSSAVPKQGLSDATPGPTTSTAQISTTPTHPAPSASPPAAVWRFTWTMPGGYHYSAILTVGHPEHVQEAAITPCTANSTTDAQIRALVTETNDTKNFAGQPGLTFQDIGGGKVPVAQDGQCRELPGEGAETTISVSANGTIPSGTSITGPFVLVVPEYYSPEHPSGNTSRLAQFLFSVFGYSPGTNGPGGLGTDVHIAGPGIDRFGRFSFAGIGG
jgi:hypothetical protein